MLKMSVPEKFSLATFETRADQRGFLKFRDWFGLAFVVLLPFVFYWRATLGLGMFFFGDIARFFFPTRVLYADALRAGRLPFWQPEILTRRLNRPMPLLTLPDMN